MHGIERAIHVLTTGLIHISSGIDPGDFIVSGEPLAREPLLGIDEAAPKRAASGERYEDMSVVDR